jgi:hypothetical protein
MLSRVTAVAAAILLAVSGGSAVAQSRADTLRDALLGGRRKPPPVARYVAGDHAFVLDRTGETPLLKFEKDEEVWALDPAPAPGGDVIYRDDLGRSVVRANRMGHLTVFTPDEPEGLPAARAGPGESLRPAAMTMYQLWRHLVRQSARVSRAVGRRIDFDAPDVEQHEAGIYADAASVTAETLSRNAPRLNGRGPLSRVNRVEFVEGQRPGAVVEGTALSITLSPEQGVAGRPSSAKVLTALDRGD